MCLSKNIFDLLQNALFYFGIIIPSLLLVLALIHKQKRKRIIKHLFLSGGILIVIFLSRFGLGQMEICAKQNKDVTTGKTTTTTSTTTAKSQVAGYVGTTRNGYTIIQKDGAYYIDDYLVVNKTYPLAANWLPKDAYSEITTETEICKTCIDNEAYADYQTMKSDAAAIGLNLYIASGYRSYDYQDGLYQSYIKKDGQTLTDTYSARAGHSEHQSGLAFDLNTVDLAFAATTEGKWVLENAYQYGYILRYPKDKSNETGYKYEPWHLRYVGKELAKALYNNGDWITMETYFGIDSKYE